MRQRHGEHDFAEVAVILTAHLCEYKTLSVAEARDMVDASDQVIYRALSRIDRVLTVYKEGRHRYLGEEG